MSRYFRVVEQSQNYLRLKRLFTKIVKKTKGDDAFEEHVRKSRSDENQPLLFAGMIFKILKTSALRFIL